jgi:gas vesicle protein
MEENQNFGTEGLNSMELMEQLKIKTESLYKEFQSLSSGVSIMDEKLKRTEYFVEQNLKELKEKVGNVKVGISPEDLRQLETYKDYFNHYKPLLYVSLFVILSGWGLGIFSALSGVKWYKESVRTKQEIRTDVLQEIKTQGNMIIDTQTFLNYREQSEALKAWQKSNPEESESFTNYFKQYQKLNKEKK